MDIKVAYLKDHTEAVPALSKIWHEVLGSVWLSDLSIEQIEQGFYDDLNDSSLPLTLIALQDNQVIGGISLYEHDEIKPELSPWIESLVVDKSYQKQGVGKLLVNVAKQKARDMHFKKLFLFTFEPNLVTYYERFDFKCIDTGRFNDRDVIIMESLV